jgi:Fibronectin type III domain
MFDPGNGSGGYPPFSNLTPTAIRANWSANGNPAGTGYWCENTDTLDNSGWTMNTYWDNTGLNPGTAYHFRVRARNGDTKDTEWGDLGLQETPLTLKLYLPLIIR